MAEKPVIAHVLSNLCTGGAEHNVVRLAAGLEARGFEQIVVSLTNRVDPELAGELCVPLLHPPQGRRVPRSAAYLAGVVRRHGVNLIHGTNFCTWADCVAARALLGCGIPLVQCIQGPAVFERQRWRQRLTMFALRPMTSAFVAVSPDIAQRLHRSWDVPSERVHVIGNIVDITRFAGCGERQALRRQLGLGSHDYLIGTVGSLYEVKNQQLLISALPKVLAAVPQARVILIGDGPTRQRLEWLCAEQRISDRVRFAGRRSDVPQWLGALDVYVQPSIHEGSPLALLEAMAAGLPPLATPSGGCCNLHAACGLPLLVDGRDPAVLAQALIQLHAEPARRTQLGRAAAEAACKLCDPSRTIGCYARLFQNTIAARQRRRRRGAVAAPMRSVRDVSD